MNREIIQGIVYLADNYSALPRHELARTSELLQAQLLQPINVTPLQPQQAERNLAIVPGSGPAITGYNEFNPLFTRDGFSLQTSGVVGSLDTYGDEVVHSGLWKNFSYSLGQFHHQSNGFRPNNSINQNIYNAYVQGNVTQDLSLLAEYRHRDVSHGDLFYYGDLDFNISEINRQNHIPDFIRKVNTDTLRFGGRLSLSSKSNLIGSLYFIDHIDNIDNYTLAINSSIRAQKGLVGEIQYNYKLEPYKLVFGAGGYSLANKDILYSFKFAKRQYNTDYANLYTYNYFSFPKNFTWIFGLSFDTLQNVLNGSQDYSQFNPKIGVQWEISKGTTIRAAAFQSLSRGVWVDSTVEPTQVAGFNQLFDSNPATKSKRYGIGIDHKLNKSMLIGTELSKRESFQPVISYPEFTLSNEKWKTDCLDLTGIGE